jgi:hypothetical protein
LPRVVDPREIDVEGGLHDTEDDRNRVEPLLGGAPDDPVEDVEEPVAAQRQEVETVNDRGDVRLSQEQELRQDADRFEDDGESPAELALASAKSSPPRPSVA